MKVKCFNARANNGLPGELIGRIMIEAHISQRYPRDDPGSVAYRQELIKVGNEFMDRGLADPKFCQDRIGVGPNKPIEFS